MLYTYCKQPKSIYKYCSKSHEFVLYHSFRMKIIDKFLIEKRYNYNIISKYSLPREIINVNKKKKTTNDGYN